MKKIYTFLFLALLLPAVTAMAQPIEFWVSSYNGSVEIFSDEALTDLVIADFGSEDGTIENIEQSRFPNGLYVRVTADEGYILGSLDVDVYSFKYKVVDNVCHIDFSELENYEEGIFLMAWFEEPRSLTMLSNQYGSLRAYTDLGGVVEYQSGDLLTDTDFDSGLFVQAIPNQGCELESLIVNGMNVTADMIDDIYIVFNPFDDVEISATFAPSSAGVEEIATDIDNAEIRIFDLKGNRVNATDAKTGFYILRQGDKSIKVYLKK